MFTLIAVSNYGMAYGVNYIYLHYSVLRLNN